MNNIYPYAGFWKRAAAWFIDSLVVYMGTMLLQQILGPLFLNPQVAQQLQQMQDKSVPFDPHILPSLMSAGVVWLIITTVLPWVYFAWMESSSKQATLGKMALGIKVVGIDGQRISFARALGRTVGKIVSGIILNIGYYMAGATRRKQALHDKMASAYVVDKNFQPGDDLPEVQTHFGILTTVIVAEILCAVAILGMIVALAAFAVKSVKDARAQSPAPVVQIQQPVSR